MAVGGADPGQCLNLHATHITQAGGFDPHIVVADPLIELPKLYLQAQHRRTRHRVQTRILTREQHAIPRRTWPGPLGKGNTVFAQQPLDLMSAVRSPITQLLIRYNIWIFSWCSFHISFQLVTVHGRSKATSWSPGTAQ